MAELLYVPLPRRFAVEDTADRLYALPERIRVISQAIVIRAHRYEAEHFLRSGAQCTRKVVDRFRRLPVFLLHWNTELEDFEFTGLSDERAGPNSPSQLLSDLRAAEFLGMARNVGATLPESDSFHYAAPNGKHYRTFLRVGSAIQSQDSLDSVSFWLLPFLTDRTVLITDSQTILALGLNVGMYLRDLGYTRSTPERALHLVESLRGYANTDLDELAERLRLANPRVDSRRQALVLSSVVSSGALTASLRGVAGALGFTAVDAVALYATDPTPPAWVTVFAQLPHAGHSYDPSERVCPVCKGSRLATPSVTLRINPQTFHLEVAQAVSRRRVVGRDATPARRFLERYSGLNVVRVHRTEFGGHGRHHAIYIDAEKLLGDSSFRQRLGERAVELRERVGVLITPNHPRAKALAAEVGRLIGRAPIVCDEDRVWELDSEKRHAIVTATEVLIVDDVVITGDRIRGYRQFLMELGRPSGAVHILVAVCRPSSEAARQSIRELVDQLDEAENTFHAIEDVTLPDWGAAECPWCTEAAALQSWLRSHRGRPPRDIVDRLASLNDTEAGLGTSAFWTWDGAPLVLGEGSVFGPASCTPAELAFSVGSALQVMRSDGRLDEEFQPPVAKLLVHEFWARGRFYAPAITAAILRMSKGHDLLPPIPSPALRRSVDERLLEPASHGLRREILLAILHGKLPLTDGAVHLSRSASDRPGFRAFLAAVLGR